MGISVSQTNSGMTIKATLSGTGTSIQKLLKELEVLKKRVARLDGAHVMFAHTITGSISPALQSMIVDEAMVQKAVSPAMRLSPRAFSPKIASGRALPDKARAITDSLRSQMQQQMTKSNRRVVLNRAQFLEIYFNDFGGYGSSPMGKILNSATTQRLK